jgi:hypothetical protein
MMRSGKHRQTGPPGPERSDVRLVSTTKKKITKTEKPFRHEPLCAVCDRPVTCGQGDSHYECRPRGATCGQPAGICLTGCPDLPPGETDSSYPIECGREVAYRNNCGVAT